LHQATWRFTSNERIHIPEAMQGPLRWLFRQRRCWKKHPLVVSMDWTKVRSFHTLMLATVVRGRALPLLWESYQEGKLPKSQNYLEERLLRVLRSLVPSWVEVIVVATAVLDARSWPAPARNWASTTSFRIQPKVYIEHRQYRGRLERFPVARGSSLLLTDVRFRKSEPVKHHVAICWPKGLPQHRDECWYLMTDLAYSVQALTKLYARRMTVEELFRDAKNRRYGLALRNVFPRASRLGGSPCQELVARLGLTQHAAHCCGPVGSPAVDSGVGVLDFASIHTGGHAALFACDVVQQ
jgi:hypothetical protein